MSTPAFSSRRRVSSFPSSASALRGPSASTFEPSDVELRVGNLDRPDPTLREQLQEPDRGEPRVDEREIGGEQRDERHQVHHLAGAVPVRQVEPDHLDGRESGLEGGDPGAVRPVAVADEKRSLVEPDRVAALGDRRLCDLVGHGNAGVAERRRHGVRLAPPPLLARPQTDDSLVPDQHRVVDVDRVRVAGIVERDDDLGARLLEQEAERLVLAAPPPPDRAPRASRSRARRRRRRAAAGARARASARPSSTGRRMRSRQPERELAEPAVALDRRMIAVGRPRLVHPAVCRLPLERRIEG